MPLTEASSSCTKIRKRRRSRMSDSTPAGMASRKMGSVAAVWISATAVGLADRSVTSQELATSRMKLPTLPSTVAAHSTANTGWRSGAKLPAGLGVLPCGMERSWIVWGRQGRSSRRLRCSEKSRAGLAVAAPPPARRAAGRGRVRPMRSPCVTRSASLCTWVTA